VRITCLRFLPLDRVIAIRDETWLSQEYLLIFVLLYIPVIYVWCSDLDATPNLRGGVRYHNLSYFHTDFTVTDLYFKILGGVGYQEYLSRFIGCSLIAHLTTSVQFVYFGHYEIFHNETFIRFVAPI